MAMGHAQRRPGHAPRRHAGPPPRARSAEPLNEGRGTHPGDTRRRPAGPCCSAPTLNEGRGTHPGDTLRRSWRAACPCGRSTKAGARTPATPPPRARSAERSRRALNEGRGTHPGDTRRRPAGACCSALPLNEGRGTHPGDTRRWRWNGRYYLRSTKAGARTPATRGGAGGAADAAARSTKAGARTPATRSGRSPCDGTGVHAQRRPGHAPRRHLRRDDVRGHQHPLNEGRGTHPGDTPTPAADWADATHAQRRPGHAPRRHCRSGCSRGSRRPTLNEGRGTHPGDTPGSCWHVPGRESAQRRPGHAPRRHADQEPAVLLLHRRSTKAGARTPATRPSRRSCSGSAMSLNEGRGTHPGDTHNVRRRDGRHPDRSTKAGARTPATHDRNRQIDGSHARSTKAGARTPATRGSRRIVRVRPCRSTKAGARTPATPPLGVSFALTITTAQRRPGHAPRRHVTHRAVSRHLHRRSTKAGARTPATLAGNGGNTGNKTAQRRPGHAPRRHPSVVGRARRADERSTKAGARTPATRHGEPGVSRGGPGRSTKAGARTPATLGTCTARHACTVDAQRRPGHAPRRHALGCRPTPGRIRTLNEGRGTHPGDTTSMSCAHDSDPPALNEGRGTHPGDTANSTKMTETGQDCPIWWTFDASQRSSLRHSAPLSTTNPLIRHRIREATTVRPLSRVGIIGGSQAHQSTHGCPNSRCCFRPKRSAASSIRPGKRYTLTESRWRSIASSTSPIKRASRAGESRHSKTESCTRWPYFPQISATRLSREAPVPSVLAMS